MLEEKENCCMFTCVCIVAEMMYEHYVLFTHVCGLLWHIIINTKSYSYNQYGI